MAYSIPLKKIKECCCLDSAIPTVTRAVSGAIKEYKNTYPTSLNDRSLVKRIVGNLKHALACCVFCKRKPKVYRFFTSFGGNVVFVGVFGRKMGAGSIIAEK